MFQAVLSAIAPIFMVLALGYICGYRKVADNKNVAVLNVFVMRFALPSALFTATWHTPLAGFIQEMPLIIVLVLAMWVLWGVTYYIARNVFKKEPAQAAVYALTISLPNYAALGAPILSSAMPAGYNVALNVAIAIACGSIFLSPLTLMVLEKETKAEFKDASMGSLLVPLLVKAFKNPIVLWPIIGTLLSCFGTTMPELLTHALAPLAAAAGGGALFLTGLILSARRLNVTGAVIFGFVLKNLVQPVVAFGIASVLGLDATIIAASVFLVALATGFFGVMFGNGFGVQDEDSEGALLLSTILFAVTIPIFMYFFM
ncbi:AEC family transporter [Vibrio jasicida]|uniref:AEC family transporter n=1 Tax=Vibrio jasicida TaxID=766224 RepID=A0ABW7JH56_9VIBR